MPNLPLLTSYADAEVHKYLQLRVDSLSFPTPYFINELGSAFHQLMKDAGIPEDLRRAAYTRYKARETPYGWYLGKGTPEQITEAIPALLHAAAIPTHILTAYGVLECMKLYGLGIDCSGFVFNVLRPAFAAAGLEADFLDSLAWQSEAHDACHAGSSAFAGTASVVVEPAGLQSLDLILIKREAAYSHIALLLSDDAGSRIVQSSLTTNPSGVTSSPFSVEKGRPVFEIAQAIGTEWSQLYEAGRIEFRRLRLLT